MIINHNILRIVGSASRQMMRWSCGANYALLSGQLMIGVLLALNHTSRLAIEFIPLQHTDECPG